MVIRKRWMYFPSLNVAFMFYYPYSGKVIKYFFQIFFSLHCIKWRFNSFLLQYIRLYINLQRNKIDFFCDCVNVKSTKSYEVKFWYYYLLRFAEKVIDILHGAIYHGIEISVFLQWIKAGIQKLFADIIASGINRMSWDFRKGVHGFRAMYDNLQICFNFS